MPQYRIYVISIWKNDATQLVNIILNTPALHILHPSYPIPLHSSHYTPPLHQLHPPHYTLPLHPTLHPLHPTLHQLHPTPTPHNSTPTPHNSTPTPHHAILTRPHVCLVCSCRRSAVCQHYVIYNHFRYTLVRTSFFTAPNTLVRTETELGRVVSIPQA